MIQAVIFDVGGVLLRTEDHQPRRALEQRLGLAPWEAEELVFNSDMGTRAQMGLATTEELWSWIQARLTLDAAGLDAFQDAFWAGDVMDSSLIAYIRRLRPRYQTAIISNATDRLRQSLTEEHQIADAFDLIVCSAEEKVMKPHLEIYQRTLHRLARRPGETVFIDDSLKNIQAARQLGMHTVHYRPGLDVPAALQALSITQEGE